MARQESSDLAVGLPLPRLDHCRKDTAKRAGNGGVALAAREA
jgi:hypothetical protein